MKIINDIVTIKIGNKIYNYKNMILNEYLNKFVENQCCYRVKENHGMALIYIYLKLKTPIKNDINAESKIKIGEFDIYSYSRAKYRQVISEQQINIYYDYIFKSYDIENYFGNKIMAIGFSTDFSKESYVDAILDTSNYNIYIEKNQEISISRKDVITTDTLFYTNRKDLIKGPVHLCPAGIEEIFKTKIYQNKAHARLYSIGLSSYPNYIDKEYIIGTDIEMKANNNEIDIIGLENYFNNNIPVYLNNMLYAGNELYPIKTNYKYVIFKYLVYQQEYIDESTELTDDFDTDCFYYQTIPINKFGKTNLKIKYERE